MKEGNGFGWAVMAVICAAGAIICYLMGEVF